MLTTTRAIIVAAVLLGVSYVAAGFFPRYAVSTTAQGFIVRHDRWTGDIAISAPGRLAEGWLHIIDHGAIHAKIADVQAVDAPR